MGRTPSAPGGATGRTVGRRQVVWAGLLAALFFIVFTGLGVWQVQRLAWKTRLIAAVDARTQMVATSAPGPAAWARITRDGDAYRRVAADGAYLRGRDTLVQAVTDLGPGFWVMTPMQTEAGFIVLVNRGFTPDRMAAAPPPPGRQTVHGLLRITEPGGGFLRKNAPSTDRWYSRDVAAIAAQRSVKHVAPYFIDADRSAAGPDWPRGGLTVVRFPNSHLAYALTWFTLAGLTVAGFVVFRRHAAMEPE